MSTETHVGDKTSGGIASLLIETHVGDETRSWIASLSIETHVGDKNAELDSEFINRDASR